MVNENVNIVEKAKRLVELCSMRSLKYDDKTQVWLSHVCIDCELDESFVPPFAHGQEHGEFTVLPTFKNKQGRTCKRKLFVEEKDVIASMQKCLKDYSRIVKKKTPYDKFVRLNDSQEWLRGLFLLADSCLDARLIYNDMPPIFKDAACSQGSATLTFREMEDLEFVSDIFSHNKIENGVSLKDVFVLWQADPDARWVLHWDDIFSAIELVAIEIVNSVARKGKWFDDVTEHKLTADTLLKSAKRKGGLQKSTQPDGRKWVHSVYEVMEVYPAYAQSIKNALNKEI